MSRRIALVAIVMCATVAACGAEPATTDEADSSTTAQVSPPSETATTKGTGSAALSAFDATATCASSVPASYQFFSAEATTVGEVRDLRAGPVTTDGQPGEMWPDAFPAAASSDPAGWCIAVDASETYAFYVVTPGHPTLDLGHQSGLLEPPPPGPPLIE